ncbi:Synembryn-A [Liparis tanakae]|uniref:Synembryn n=1 Tax=Liparis tanakae TaxID=230148 RepID=A0A4Z2GL79_9TELE|nr:Synembryn-A [Liparis tanakae]
MATTSRLLQTSRPCFLYPLGTGVSFLSGRPVTRISSSHRVHLSGHSRHFATRNMGVDLEGIIQCIKQGDENGVEVQLQDFNKEFAQCFFFDSEESERRKFRINKVRDYDDSDSDGDQFIRSGATCRLLRVSLRTLRILSRDKKVLGPLVTDAALLALAGLAGLTAGDGGGEEPGEPDADFYDGVIASLAKAKALRSLADEDEGEGEVEVEGEGDGDAESDVGEERDGFEGPGTGSNGAPGGSRHHKVLERGRRDRRKSRMDGEQEEQGEEDEEERGGAAGEEAQRKEALKVLCNVVYNSTWAQERFSGLSRGDVAQTHLGGCTCCFAGLPLGLFGWVDQ